MAEIAPTAVSEPIAVAEAAPVDDEKNINVFVPSNFVVGNSRKLHFRGINLDKDLNLLLMFDPPKQGELYNDLFPVCWKVIALSQGTLSLGNTEYTAKTALLVPQVTEGNLVVASAVEACETGQRCILKSNAKGHSYITPASPGTPGLIKCTNDSGHPAEIGIGFLNAKSTSVEPALYWKNIGQDSILSTTLTPYLKIYAVHDFQATELIRGDIETPILWQGNLIALSQLTTFEVTVELGSGKVQVKQVAN